MGYYLPGPTGVVSPGVAPDGLKGQYLRKASDIDFDTEWVDIVITGGGGGGSGSVTSVSFAAPTGFSVTGNPVTDSGTITLAFAAGYSLPTTASQGNWDTAYTERLRWDGGSTGLNLATAQASLGLSSYAPLASPALTGTPTAPTAAAGTNTTQIATTAFVTAAADASRQGLSVKLSCRAATTAPISLSGTQTVDGVALAIGDRVLVKNQTGASQNGIYNVTGGPWIRSTDFDADSDIVDGAFTFVEEGTTNADTGWVLTTNGPVTVGTTALSFAQFSSSGSGVSSFSGGTTGLTPAIATTGAVTLGGTLAVPSGGTGTTSSTGSGSVVLSNSPSLVTPALGTPTSGTLTNCTGYTFANVASKPTTLSGYGITDGFVNSVVTNRLLGRSTAGTGVAEEITIGTGLSLSGGTLTATGGGGGGTSSAVRIDSTSTANTIYVGKAAAGSSESSAVWTITRTTLDAAGVQTGSSTITAVTWTGRTSHTYP